MTGRPYILSELTYQTTRETAYDLAVLPWGATEAHNLHLPYGTDTIETERIAAEAARIAWDQGARVIVLPAVPFGVQTGKLDVPLCLNVNPSTQLHLLRDLADGLARNGLKKLVVLNGHGGNDFRQMIRELLPTIPMFVCAVNWYAVVDPAPHFTEPGEGALLVHRDHRSRRMAWIRTVAPEEATGALKAEYDAAVKRAGRVWNIVRIKSLNPPALKASLTLYQTLMFGRSPLSRGQREMLAVVVSRTNGCRY